MEKKKKRRRKFRHLNQFDRDRIEALKKAGHNQKEIAEILKVSESAISREKRRVKRKNEKYDAKTAQNQADNKRRNSKYQGMKIENNSELKKHIISELKERSPDEIAGRMKKEKISLRVSCNSIYKWLYSSYGQQYCKYLCSKRYKKRKQKKNKKREMIPNRISLKQRPNEGIHGEGDLFVSGVKTGSKRSGAIICVPDSKLIIATFIPNKKTTSMTKAVKKLTEDILINDLTLDNGIENRDHENFGIKTYFADPHAPWQKAHVENNIGLLRRWFIKKGSNLSKISERELQEYLYMLNGKYRKSLGYRSAFEVSLELGIIKKIPSGVGLIK